MPDEAIQTPVAGYSIDEEILPEGTDPREYLTDKGHTDLLTIRMIEDLIERGEMPVADLPRLIEHSRIENKPLTEMLIKFKVATEADILRVRAEIHNMEPVTLADVDVVDTLTHLITAEQAVQWHALPYSRNDLSQLLVAITDPEDIQTRENLTKALPREDIQFRLAAPTELGTYIERYYNVGVESLASELQASASDADENMIVREQTFDQPVIRLVNEVIQQAQDQHASDIHIEPRTNDTMIRFRVDGMLREVMEVQKRITPQIVARIKTMANMRADERRVPQDGRVALTVNGKVLDLRVVSTPTIHGEQVTMRLLDPTQAMLSLEELGMSDANLERYLGSIRKAHGVALITGPTGSGKSTTLYSSLRRIITPERKVISIEDPVEYQLQGIAQIDVSGGSLMGEDAHRMTFANALRSVLRSDPDIIMVGEIRDQETAQISVDASLTGHFLFSTLHTNDALSAVTRMKQLGISPFLVAEATEVIVAQRLLRRLCPSCREAYEVDEALLEKTAAPDKCLAWAREHGHRTMYRASAKGCPECAGVGYRGRLGVHEVIEVTSELRQAIVEEQSHQLLVEIARSQGMASLQEDAFMRAWEGLTSLEEVERVTA